MCKRSEAAPIERPWDLRPSNFLIEALSQHGVLASLWCLQKLLNRTQESFYFLPSTNLYRNYKGSIRISPDAEIDILCVRNGVVHLCEVKSSARGLDSKDIQRFAKIAQEIRPDVAVLAVMDEKNNNIDNRFEELRKILEPYPIKCQLLTLNENDFEDIPSIRRHSYKAFYCLTDKGCQSIKIWYKRMKEQQKQEVLCWLLIAKIYENAL